MRSLSFDNKFYLKKRLCNLKAKTKPIFILYSVKRFISLPWEAIHSLAPTWILKLTQISNMTFQNVKYYLALNSKYRLFDIYSYAVAIFHLTFIWKTGHYLAQLAQINVLLFRFKYSLGFLMKLILLCVIPWCVCYKWTIRVMHKQYLKTWFAFNIVQF